MNKQKIRKLFGCLTANEHDAVLTGLRKEKIDNAEHIIFQLKVEMEENKFVFLEKHFKRYCSYAWGKSLDKEFAVFIEELIELIEPGKVDENLLMKIVYVAKIEKDESGEPVIRKLTPKDDLILIGEEDENGMQEGWGVLRFRTDYLDDESDDLGILRSLLMKIKKSSKGRGHSFFCAAPNTHESDVVKGDCYDKRRVPDSD